MLYSYLGPGRLQICSSNVCYSTHPAHIMSAVCTVSLFKATYCTCVTVKEYGDTCRFLLCSSPPPLSLPSPSPSPSPHLLFCRREGVMVERFYYALTWTCRFPVLGDTCYFAHCFPYTYSDLKVRMCYTQTH